MRLLCSSLLIILTGCSSTPIEVKQTEFYFTLIETEDSIIYEGKERSGLTRYSDGWCEVTVPKGELTNCLLHEVLHCVGGEWHGDRESYEYCGK